MLADEVIDYSAEELVALGDYKTLPSEPGALQDAATNLEISEDILSILEEIHGENRRVARERLSAKLNDKGNPDLNRLVLERLGTEPPARAYRAGLGATYFVVRLQSPREMSDIPGAISVLEGWLSIDDETLRNDVVAAIRFLDPDWQSLPEPGIGEEQDTESSLRPNQSLSTSSPREQDSPLLATRADCARMSARQVPISSVDLFALAETCKALSYSLDSRRESGIAAMNAARLFSVIATGSDNISDRKKALNEVLRLLAASKVSFYPEGG